MRTERCHITLLQPDQAHLLVQYHLLNREHIAPWEPERGEDFYQLDTMRKAIAGHWRDFILGRSAHFAALDHAHQRVLATCSLQQIQRQALNMAVLGYSVSKDMEGTGLMHEVAQAVMDYAWRDLKLHQLQASHASDNRRSRRLLLRLGFREVGMLPRYLKTPGGWQDHRLYHCLNPLEAGNHGLPSLLGADGE